MVQKVVFRYLVSNQGAVEARNYGDFEEHLTEND